MTNFFYKCSQSISFYSLVEDTDFDFKSCFKDRNMGQISFIYSFDRIYLLAKIAKDEMQQSHSSPVS